MNNYSEDLVDQKTIKALQLYEEDQSHFKNHWIWRELQTTPECFFKSVKTYIEKLNISKDQWIETYHRAKQIHRTLVLEKTNTANPQTLKMMKSIKV